MTKEQKKIIKGYCWAATTLGLVVGPGVDAAPLAGLWVAGVIHLVKEAEIPFDETEIKSAVATIVAGFGAWFISGKIAQVVAGLLVAGGLAGAGVTGGLTIFIGGLATLSLNATINALFTYRFLKACAGVIEDEAAAGGIFMRAFANVITDQLLSLVEIPRDIVEASRLMFIPII